MQEGWRLVISEQIRAAGSDLDRASQLLDSLPAANNYVTRHVKRTRRSRARRKLELIVHLPKLILMTSALQVMLPFLKFRAQMMSLTLLLPLPLMSSVATLVTSASDPSTCLEVCQVISQICQNWGRTVMVFVGLSTEWWDSWNGCSSTKSLLSSWKRGTYCGTLENKSILILDSFYIDSLKNWSRQIDSQSQSMVKGRLTNHYG